MTFEESYQKYLILAEANGTTDKLSTNKARYAVKYNLQQNKIIEWLIESNGTDENRYIQSIKVPEKTLTKQEEKKEYTNFLLPEDYFDHIGLTIWASKDNCKEQRIKSQEVKASNTDNMYLDEYSKPSFKYRETFYTIKNDAVQAYKKDFTIDKVNMTYYRKPKQITLVNPDNPESQFTQDQLEFDDKLINRIILSTVALHELSSDDPKFQAFKSETISKF